MKWNSQQAEWSHFSYDQAKFDESEKRLLLGAGFLFGGFKHLDDEDKRQLTIEIISNEASSHMMAEMEQFITWFNDTSPTGKKPLPALLRAGIAHPYFVSIHPFEDGNGRIGRALAEKALAQCLGQPTLIAIAYTIERNKKAYYTALEQASRRNEITSWLTYFAALVLDAQSYTATWIEFLINNAKLYDRLRGQLNPRQEKVLTRLFREGTEGFIGGLSAEKYIGITGAPRATATRDLQDLEGKGALLRCGELKHTRYLLNLEAN